MKRILLGTTALVAASLAASEAVEAADGVKLGIGGRYMGAMGALAIDDFSASPDPSNNLRAYVFKQDVRVYFEGSTTLDNGLTVGARIDLRGQSDNKDQIRDVYAYFKGGFGDVRFGDTEEALAQTCYLVPSASALFGADSPNFNFSNAGVIGFGATNGTCYGVDSHSTKIVYFSPTLPDSVLPLHSRRTTRKTLATRSTAPQRAPATISGRTRRTSRSRPTSIMTSVA